LSFIITIYFYVPKSAKSIYATLTINGLFKLLFFLYTELPIQTSEVNKDADAGKLIWQKYNCNACHQVYGLGGYLGPDLTNVYSTRGSKYIQAFLKTGTGAMPQFNLTETETSMLLVLSKNH
jgi:nitric oxide reductase subunit C